MKHYSFKIKKQLFGRVGLKFEKLGLGKEKLISCFYTPVIPNFSRCVRLLSGDSSVFLSWRRSTCTCTCTSQCGDCTTLGRTITYQTHSTTYQQMRKVDSTVPDLVLVRNCWFSEYPWITDIRRRCWPGASQVRVRSHRPKAGTGSKTETKMFFLFSERVKDLEKRCKEIFIT
jgi:hypothetical protein